MSGGADCVASGGFGFDNCNGSVTVNVKCAISSGELVVTLGSSGDFIVCNSSVTPGSISGLITVPCTGQAIVQGDCPPGDSIVVGDDNTLTIGEGTVPFGWVCEPGS